MNLIPDQSKKSQIAFRNLFSLEITQIHQIQSSSVVLGRGPFLVQHSENQKLKIIIRIIVLQVKNRVKIARGHLQTLKPEKKIKRKQNKANFDSPLSPIESPKVVNKNFKTTHDFIQAEQEEIQDLQGYFPDNINDALFRTNIKAKLLNVKRLRAKSLKNDLLAKSQKPAFQPYSDHRDRLKSAFQNQTDNVPKFLNFLYDQKAQQSVIDNFTNRDLRVSRLSMNSSRDQLLQTMSSFNIYQQPKIQDKLISEPTESELYSMMNSQKDHTSYEQKFTFGTRISPRNLQSSEFFRKIIDFRRQSPDSQSTSINFPYKH